jgi:ATPase subunit of ABC transporter with duplicated ATPase domains
LVGRNGCGKSTLLKAIADKLIPGIPEETKIALLQQTRLTDDGPESRPSNGPAPTVLQEVVDKAIARSLIEHEIKTLSDGVDASDPHAPVRALRGLKHERLQKRLFILDKDARLRSGARGLQARKALKTFEKVVAESNTLLEQPLEDISADTLQAEIQEAADMLADLQIQVEPSRLADIESSAKRVMAGLGFSDAQMAKPIDSLSGGWHMRASLACVLIQPDIDLLVLDEPTNFLDMLGIIWLQRHLLSLEDTERPPTLILVSHDRDFISVCTDLLLIKDKQLVNFHGDLPTYEASQSERKLYLTKMKEAQDKQKAHIEKTIAANIKTGTDHSLKQAKSRQKKLDDRWGMQVNSKGGRFRLNDRAGFFNSTREEVVVPQDERGVLITLPEPPDLRFPGALVSLENVSLRYKGAPASTLKDVSLSVNLGDRAGIVGQNGTGKSTLIKVLTGQAPSSAGTVKVHPRARVGYYSQHAVEALQSLGRAEPELTSLALLTREAGGELTEQDLRGLLGALGLPGRLASDLPVGKLSGGQLVRCELARLFWKRPHCLILDEVTTHLDYQTVTALREAIRAWEGAVVVVSHDRWFIRGAVEGQRDEGESEDEEDSAEESTARGARKRVTYRLKAGGLVPLERGVEEFEEAMEKRASKLLQV